jgi:hypothetical protein
MSSTVVNEAPDVANHFCAVAAGKVLFGCRTWRKALQSLAEVFVGVECLQNALQPFFRFEVRHSRVMPEECGVVEEIDGHPFKILLIAANSVTSLP